MTATEQMKIAGDLSERAMWVHERMGEEYGIRPWERRREPLHELISTILSHRTNGANEDKAFNQMWERYGGWEGIAAAPVEGITEAIAPANFPEVKAPRIKAVLQQIIAERGTASIDFLADLPLDAAMAWLTALPGVGTKTATLVLLFCFRQPVLPVDTHVHRVSQRVGLIGPKATPDQAHNLLMRLLPHEADLLWNFHHNMLKHGQRVCVWNTPRCERCVLRERCDYYHAVREPKNQGTNNPSGQ